MPKDVLETLTRQDEVEVQEAGFALEAGRDDQSWPSAGTEIIIAAQKDELKVRDSLRGSDTSGKKSAY